jgi:hypothetical protein
MTPLVTIHEAGPLVNGLQECARCGYVLTDYRHAMIPEGDPEPCGWADGAFIEVSDGNPRYSSTTEDEPTCRRLS